MATVDVLIIVAFIAYSLCSGLASRRVASTGLESYFLADRSLGGWAAGISMAATQFAADTPLLVTGLIATAGIFSLWRLWIYALAFLLLGFVLAPSWRRAGVLTDAELTEIRYGGAAAAWLRGVKAIYFGTVFNCTVLAMVLFATKEIAEPFLHWDRWLPSGLFNTALGVVQWVGVELARAGGEGDIWIRSTNNAISIAAIVFVTATYSTTGGLRSVVRTDVMQFFVMLLGTALYAYWVVDAAGGMAAVVATIRERFATGSAAGGGLGGINAEQILAFIPSRAKDASLVVLAMFAMQWLIQMNADGTGYLAQRSMACRSDRDAKLASVVFTVAQIFLRSLLWLPIGLGLLVLFPVDPSLPPASLRADREATFVLGMRDYLPPGVLGLMLTGMLAALASTIDTHLNWGASYWTNDIYKRFVCEKWRKKTPSQRSLVWVARGANLLIVILALLIMTRLSSIQAAWQASLLLGAGMGMMLVLRWLWWRVTAWGELSSICASLVLALTLPVVLPGLKNDALRLLLMALGSTAVGIVVSLRWPESMSGLQAFYQRVRPPGFWGPVARACGVAAGDDRRRLARGLLAMASAALSIFSLLTAVGAYLVESAPPIWLPHRDVWLVGMFAVGVGLIPIWWRLGFGPEGEHAMPQRDAPGLLPVGLSPECRR